MTTKQNTKTYGGLRKAVSIDDTPLITRQIDLPNTDEESNQQNDHNQQLTNQAANTTQSEKIAKKTTTLNRIDDARRLLGELTDQQLQDKDKDPSKINNYDILAKEFKKLINNKSKANANYYIDDNRAEWMKRFINAFKSYASTNDVTNKRKREDEDIEENQRKDKDAKTHGQSDLMVNKATTPDHWIKAPVFTPEYAIRVNKLAESNQAIKQHVENLIFENPDKLGKITAVYTAYKGIKVVCESPNIQQMVKENLKLIDPQLELKTLNFNNPTIKINDITLPFELPETSQEMEKVKKKIANNIYEANDIKDKTQIEIIHIFKQGKSKKFGMIIQLTAHLRSYFQKKNGKIFVGPGQYEFSDCFDFKICLKCKRVGHPGNKCRSTIRCEFCSRPQHDKCDVENKPDEWFCANCSKNGHKFNSLRCERFQKILINAMRKVNYPYDWIIQPIRKDRTEFTN